MNPYLLINVKQKYSPPPLTDHNAVYNLMRKLSYKLQVICALESVKLMMSTWAGYMSKNILLSKENILTSKEKESFKGLIEAVEKFVKGEITKEEFKKVDDTRRRLKDNIYGTDAIDNANAAFNQIFGLIINDDISSVSATSALSVANVVNYACFWYVTVSSKNKADTFYKKWYKSCYLLIQEEFQTNYDILVKSINGEISYIS